MSNNLKGNIYKACIRTVMEARYETWSLKMADNPSVQERK